MLNDRVHRRISTSGAADMAGVEYEELIGKFFYRDSALSTYMSLTLLYISSRPVVIFIESFSSELCCCQPTRWPLLYSAIIVSYQTQKNIGIKESFTQKTKRCDRAGHH